LRNSASTDTLNAAKLSLFSALIKAFIAREMRSCRFAKAVEVGSRLSAGRRLPALLGLR